MTATDVEPRVIIGGPHPDLDALLAGEPEGSHVRELFQPADDYQRAEYAVVRPAPAALEPDAVHDPEPVTVITQARLISATPTGSIRLDQMRLVTDYYGGDRG